MPTAFITGITGQTGSYLAEHLLSEGWDVHGMYRSRDAETAAFSELVPAAKLAEGDLADPSGLATIVAELKPDAIFNLGGLSSVATSWDNPALVGEINGVAVAALLAAAWKLRTQEQRPVAFVQASSAELFGNADEIPQTESTPIRPTNPYGASKAFAHHLVGVYRELGLEASSCILYNHESPRRPDTFVTRKITKGVAAIAAGTATELVLGNLDVKRDWGWAPDYARAIALAAGRPDDYVVATGESHSVREFVEVAFRAAGITDWERFVGQDPRFMRPTDAAELVGDSTRLRGALGWSPSVTFVELITRMVTHDLALTRRD